MRFSSQNFILTLFTILFSCTQYNTKIVVRTGLAGNNIVEFIKDKNDKQFFDPIDDTVNFKRVVDNIYIDYSSNVYILSICSKSISEDTFLYLEYFKKMTDFIDIKSYKKIKDSYFQNKGKVYMWWSNSDGDYPIEVTSADPETFIPFDSVAGGIDKQHVFYGGVPGDFETIDGADPKSIQVLNPEKGCWNCGNCYFVDSKNVYFGLTKMEGADPITFKLINSDKIDAQDKRGQYFDGQLIK